MLRHAMGYDISKEELGLAGPLLQRFHDNPRSRGRSDCDDERFLSTSMSVAKRRRFCRPTQLTLDRQEEELTPSSPPAR